MADTFDLPYVGDVHRWWHLSRPSPELLSAERDGWLGPPGVALDVGCGLGVEADYLAQRGWHAMGVDLALAALRTAQQRSGRAQFARADVLRLPVANGRVDLLVDRGCFHYLSTEERSRYVLEARRTLRPSGRLLLRACLTAAGIRNELDEERLHGLFAGWRIDSIAEALLPSDTRWMPALVARLIRL